MDCIFCAIIKGDIPSSKVYEDDKILAFRDIAPQVPVHVIVIPKVHIPSANELDEGNADVAGYIMVKIPKIAAELGLTNGYRIVTNIGEDGAQSVKHLHFHILGGKKLPANLGE